jgi:Arc/MetJ-type ribon-helix-helix transcriptional regulator
MKLDLPPDLEELIQKRLATGAYATAEDVVRRALEAQDAEEAWSEEERRAIAHHIEDGYLQAERSDYLPAAEARRDIQAMKDAWRSRH